MKTTQVVWGIHLVLSTTAEACFHSHLAPARLAITHTHDTPGGYNPRLQANPTSAWKLACYGAQSSGLLRAEWCLRQLAVL